MEIQFSCYMHNSGERLIHRVLPTLVGTGRHLPHLSHLNHLFSIEKWCKHAKVEKNSDPF